MRNLLEVSIVQVKAADHKVKPRKRGFALLIESLHEGNTFIKYESIDQLKYELYHDGIQKILADHKLYLFLALLNDNLGQYILNGTETCVRTEIIDDVEFKLSLNLVARTIRRKYHFNMSTDIMGIVIANRVSEVFIQCLKEERSLGKEELENLVDELYNKNFTEEARKSMFTNKKNYAETISFREGNGDKNMNNLPLQGKLVTDIPGTIRTERNGKVYVHKETDPNGVPLAVEYPNGQVYMPNSMHYSGGRQTTPVKLTQEEIDLMDVSAMYPTQIKDILKNK